MLLKRTLLAFTAGLASLLSLPALADDFADALAAYDRHDYPTAARLFEPLAERGDMRAALFLGAAYYTGLGVRIDRYKTMEWMMRANAGASPADFDFVYGHWQTLADAGDPDAQVALGTAYNSRLGVPVDVDKAFALIKKSADQGYAPGQAGLGALYDSGDGVPKNAAEAHKWFVLAAEQGNTWAQCAIGGMYEAGRGVKKDRDAALSWFRRAADGNYAEAQYELGVAYDQGIGVRSDQAEALKWYRLAAAGGSPLAQNNLAVSYLRGIGVPSDPALAFEFSTLAVNRVALVKPEYQRRMLLTHDLAQGGLGAAQKRAALFQLGERCRDGDGVPQDVMLAYRWMDLSTRDEPDENLRATRLAARDKLIERMQPGQAERAKALVGSGPEP